MWLFSSACCRPCSIRFDLFHVCFVHALLDLGSASPLLQTLVPLLTEDDADVLGACWEALGAVTASIPKEMQPSFVRCLKVRRWRWASWRGCVVGVWCGGGGWGGCARCQSCPHDAFLTPLHSAAHPTLL